MPSFLQIKLSESEDKTLKELSLANNVPKRTKQRAIALRLNHRGKTVAQIKDYLQCGAKMVRQAIHRWEEKGLGGLWDEKRVGRKRTWTQQHWQIIEQCLAQERSYTSKQLAQKLKQETGVELGAEQVRRILKKKNWRWKRMRRKPPQTMDIKQIEAKKKDLEMLKQWAKMGLWEENERLEYGLIATTLNSSRYIECLDAQASQAAKRLFKTGKLTVIVNDNASIHKSFKVRQRYSYWEKQGLLIFYQASYHPQMNRMEDQWLHLKRDELKGRVFEDELELVDEIINGMNNRGKQAGFEVERFAFN